VEIPLDPGEREKAQQEGKFDIEFLYTTIDTVDKKFRVVRIDPFTSTPTPEKNATVYFSRDFDLGNNSWTKVFTDDNGETVIRRSVPSKRSEEHRVLGFLAMSEDGSMSGIGYWNETIANDPDEIKTIELHPSVTLKGRFVTRNGEPFSDGFLRISMRPEGHQSDLGFANAFVSTDRIELFNARPDQDGRFEIKGLFPNPYNSYAVFILREVVLGRLKGHNLPFSSPTLHNTPFPPTEVKQIPIVQYSIRWLRQILPQAIKSQTIINT
jgi:hypothetical protein